MRGLRKILSVFQFGIVLTIFAFCCEVRAMIKSDSERN